MNVRAYWKCALFRLSTYGWISLIQLRVGTRISPKSCPSFSHPSENGAIGDDLVRSVGVDDSSNEGLDSSVAERPACMG